MGQPAWILSRLPLRRGSRRWEVEVWSRELGRKARGTQNHSQSLTSWLFPRRTQVTSERGAVGIHPYGSPDLRLS